MRNHHHNSQSIIAALPLANDIYKIKKYKGLSDIRSIYYALYCADDAKKSNKSSMTTLLILSFYCIYFIFTIY